MSKALSKFIVSLIFINGILFVGCHKNNNEIVKPIPAALIKACLFQKNSYWVYRNDSTGVTDCTYLKSDPIWGVVQTQDSTFFNYTSKDDQFVIMPLVSNLIYQFYISAGRFNYETSFGYPFLVDLRGINVCWPGIPAFLISSDSLFGHQGSQVFNCIWQEHSFWICEGNAFRQVLQYTNYKINELTFNHVDYTRTLIQPGILISHLINDTIDFYFSPGNGLVKMVIIGDTMSQDSLSHKRKTQSWSLIRYHTVH